MQKDIDDLNEMVSQYIYLTGWKVGKLHILSLLVAVVMNLTFFYFDQYLGLVIGIAYVIIGLPRYIPLERQMQEWEKILELIPFCGSQSDVKFLTDRIVHNS